VVAENKRERERENINNKKVGPILCIFYFCCKSNVYYSALLTLSAAFSDRIIIIITITIIITKTMFMVLSSWQSHCESSPGSFDECRTAPSSRRPKTKPDDLRGVYSDATQLNSTSSCRHVHSVNNCHLSMNVVTQLTQFVGHDVINKNTTNLAVRCSTGSVELS